MFKFFDKYLNNPQAYQNDGEWIYERQFTIDEGNLTINENNELTMEDIDKEDNIINLTILKQGTAQEEFKKEIDRRIRELQNNGETKDYIDERIGLEFAEREFELINKTIDDLEVNKNEDLKLEKELNNQNKEIESYKDIENILGSDIKTISEVEKTLGKIKDTKLREKLLKYSSGRDNA